MSTQNLPDKAGVIMFPPIMYIITLATGLTLSYFFPYTLLSKSVAIPLGVIIAILGILGIRLAAGLFVKRKTTVHPKGSSTTVVSDGIFKYSRNPMYVSFALINVGISIAFNAWIGLLLLIPLLIVVQKGVIEREERYMTRKFGEEYLRYKARVRRWF